MQHARNGSIMTIMTCLMASLSIKSSIKLKLAVAYARTVLRIRAMAGMHLYFRVRGLSLCDFGPTAGSPLAAAFQLT